MASPLPTSLPTLVSTEGHRHGGQTPGKLRQIRSGKRIFQKVGTAHAFPPILTIWEGQLVRQFAKCAKNYPARIEPPQNPRKPHFSGHLIPIRPLSSPNIPHPPKWVINDAAHTLRLSGARAATRFRAFAEGIESAEWQVPGHFVADITIDDSRQEADEWWVELSALTIEDW